MSVFQAEDLQNFTAALFVASGAPVAEGRTVAEALVRADMMGLPSHGVLRIIQYIKDIRRGSIVPGAELLIEDLSPAVALVDAQWNFGQVAAMEAVQLALDRARTHGLGSALVRRNRHVGRVGAYTEAAARAGFAALARAPRGSAPASIGLSSPGMTGTPDSIMSVRADILSPIVSIA